MLNNAVGWMVSSYFQILQSLYQTFGDHTEHTDYIGITVTFMVHSFFQFSSKG